MLIKMLKCFNQLLFLIFLIEFNSGQKYTQLSLLKIDPLSIYVDPNLYQLCWNYIRTSPDEKIVGNEVDIPKIPVYFQVVRDYESSNETFCISKRNKKEHLIQLPFNKYNLFNVITLHVDFSRPLGPPIDVIRIQTVPKGIHFQLNPEFRSIEKSSLVKCNVTLLYSTYGEEGVLQFSISSILSEQRIFKKIPPNSNFTAFSTCLIEDFIKSSSALVKYEGNTWFSEITFNLKPFIPVAFQRFILVVWENFKFTPDVYNVAIYEKLKSGQENCVKVFRMCKNNNLNCEWNSIARLCNNLIKVEDLGFYKNDDKYVYVILDMVYPMKIYSKYKLSIFWTNYNGDVLENFLYFAPIPNENIVNINPIFLNFTHFSYEDLRNNISDMKQNVNPANTVNPVFGHINLIKYEKWAILPSVSTRNQLNFDKIDNLVKETIIESEIMKKCVSTDECLYGFYAFFYLFLQNENYLEVVQIPKPTDKIQFIKVKLVSNNYQSSLKISWKISGNPTCPSLFGIKIINRKSKTCQAVYVIKCKTCSDKYNKISAKFLPKFSECNTTTINLVDNYFHAADKSFSIETGTMPTEISFSAQIFAVQFDIVTSSDFSNEDFLRDGSKKAIVIGTLVSAFLLVGLLLSIIGLQYFWRTKLKAKSSRELEVNKNQCNDSIYDEDVYDKNSNVSADNNDEGAENQYE